MQGSSNVLDMVSLDSIFSFDETEFEVAPQDQEQMDKRRATLNGQFREACNTLFAGALEKAQAA
eukprot:8003602-Pyramimonas_sp.AAC.1